MRLNHDCVRKLLLFIEENLGFDKELCLPNKELCDFTDEEVLYTANKLFDAGYIRVRSYGDFSGATTLIKVYDITWEGHQFLDTIRDNQVWLDTKRVLAKVSSASISFVSKIASQVLANLINKQLGSFDTNSF